MATKKSADPMSLPWDEVKPEELKRGDEIVIYGGKFANVTDLDDTRFPHGVVIELDGVERGLFPGKAEDKILRVRR